MDKNSPQANRAWQLQGRRVCWRADEGAWFPDRLLDRLPSADRAQPLNGRENHRISEARCSFTLVFDEDLQSFEAFQASGFPCLRQEPRGLSYLQDPDILPYWTPRGLRRARVYAAEFRDNFPEIPVNSVGNSSGAVRETGACCDRPELLCEHLRYRIPARRVPAPERSP